jgi:hypothetical protein
MVSLPSVEESSKPRFRQFAWLLAIAVIAIASVSGVGTYAWYQGGTHLTIDGTEVGVHPARVGRPVSFGISLTTRGGPSVVVDTATAKHSADIDLQYAIIHTGPGEPGIGTANGTIPGATPLGTHGIRAAQREVRGATTACTVPPVGERAESTCTQPVSPPRTDLGATWLVVTVTARRPGPWSVTHITVTYRSWWRTRTATSNYHVTGRASPA